MTTKNIIRKGKRAWGILSRIAFAIMFTLCLNSCRDSDEDDRAINNRALADHSTLIYIVADKTCPTTARTASNGYRRLITMPQIKRTGTYSFTWTITTNCRPYTGLTRNMGLPKSATIRNRTLFPLPLSGMYAHRHSTAADARTL